MREGKKAVMLWCKPLPIAAEPCGNAGVSRWLFLGGRSQPLPDPVPQGKGGFAGGLRGGKSKYPKPVCTVQGARVVGGRVCFSASHKGQSLCI